MAKEPKGGVSLRREDRTAAVLGIGPGRTTLKKIRYEMFEYIPKGKTRGTVAPVALAYWERDGETVKTPYSIGSGWKIEEKGLRVRSRSGAKGIPEGCNFAHLLDSLEGADKNPMPGDYLETLDQLDGIEVELISKPIERDFRSKDKDKADEGVRKSTLLVVGEVHDAPWVGNEGKKKKKGKPADDEDEEEQDEDEDADEDDDDEEETPKKKGKGKDADDDDEEEEEESDDDDSDDDDEDETPKGKKGKKPADDDDEEEEPKAKGKKRSAAEEDIDETAVEAVTDLLEETETVKVKDLENLLLKRLKKAKLPNYDEVAARAIEDDFLDQEKGWVRKGSSISLDK